LKEEQREASPFEYIPRPPTDKRIGEIVGCGEWRASRAVSFLAAVSLIEVEIHNGNSRTIKVL
jgi:hypothetical protein